MPPALPILPDVVNVTAVSGADPGCTGVGVGDANAAGATSQTAPPRAEQMTSSLRRRNRIPHPPRPQTPLNGAAAHVSHTERHVSTADSQCLSKMNGH